MVVGPYHFYGKLIVHFYYHLMEKSHIDLAYLLFKFNIFVFIPSEYLSSNEHTTFSSPFSPLFILCLLFIKFLLRSTFFFFFLTFCVLIFPYYRSLTLTGLYILLICYLIILKINENFK